MSGAERLKLHAAIAELMQIRTGITTGRLTLSLVYACVGEVADDLMNLIGKENAVIIEPRRRDAVTE